MAQTKLNQQQVLQRYFQFIGDLDNLNVKPLKLFNDLTPKQLQELELIREISQYLQKKKDEDAAAAKAKDEVKENEEVKEEQK